MQRSEIQSRVEDVKFWFHKIDLGHGIVTPGFTDSWAFDKLNLPDLHGKTVLDVGCWDGLYSFECEKRGAKRVLSTDHYTWNHKDFGMKGFLTAREILKSKVEYKDIDIFDISPETVGTWDIVLLLGVLYHLQNPLLALERVATVTKSLLVIESHVASFPFHDDVPLMEFYETDELNKDPTNWWGPNVACMLGMMRSAGFELAELQRTGADDGQARLRKTRAPTFPRCMKMLLCGSDKDFRKTHDRAIFHAWKKKEMKDAFLRADNSSTHLSS